MAPLSRAELKIQQRGVVLAAGLALVVCALVLALAYVCLPHLFEFPKSLAERMAFAVQAEVFVFLWVVFGVRQVADGRFRSAADNRGSAYAPPSGRLAIPVAFLQNTLEQAVMAAGAHLALATLVAGNASRSSWAPSCCSASGGSASCWATPKARADGLLAWSLLSSPRWPPTVWLYT